MENLKIISKRLYGSAQIWTDVITLSKFSLKESASFKVIFLSKEQNCQKVMNSDEDSPSSQRSH
jgi:hypothetical protein